jgi:hypothetical protein
LKKTGLLAIAVFCFALLHAQSLTPLRIEAQVSTTPASFFKLKETLAAIRNNDTLNEEVVDLVNVMEADTVVPRPTQWHRVAVIGLMLRTFGFRWLAVDMKRHKFVGTVKGGISTPAGEEYSERDMNMDVFAHLPAYKQETLKAYKKQQGMWRARKKRKTDYFDFVNDSLIHRKRMHCELTPPYTFIELLNAKFYPCYPGTTFENHNNWGVSNPSLGMYGPLVLDCNHSCHPEMHPYEWLWWLDVNPLHEKPYSSKRWVLGLMRESSSRFRGWCKSPRVGKIAIPFLYDLKQAEQILSIEHLVFGTTVPSALKKLNLPEGGTNDFKFSNKDVEVFAGNNKVATLHIKANHPLMMDGVVWWLSEVKFDAESNLLSGYFNIAASVKDVYSAAVEVVSKNPAPAAE